MGKKKSKLIEKSKKMSFGPQLPSHLQKPPQESESESDDDQSYGPRLPSVPCLGPKPAQSSESDSEDESDSVGPKLPSVACRGPGPSVVGPQRPPGSSSVGPPVASNVGPQMPPGFVANREESSSDDESMIGPQPPKPGEEISPEEAIKRNIEARAQKMEDKLLGRNQNAEPKRETWMTELPKTVSKNFGLGPRQFSRNTNAKTKQDKTWTQTPNEIAAGEGSEEAPNPEQDEEVLAYMASLQRDAQMDKVSEELKKKRGNDTLMELHEKKIKKKEKKEKEKNKPVERRPFDRDVDLSANRFDDARKKAMIKKTAGLDSKFGHGTSKYI